MPYHSLYMVMKKQIFILSLLFLFLVGCSGEQNIPTKTPTPDIPTLDVPTEPTPDIPTVDVPTEPTPDIPTEIDYGELIIPKLTIYTNFPDKPSPYFTNEEYASEISYNVLYSPIVTYSDGYFYASGEGSAMVEATTEYHSTVFIVEAFEYQSVRGENQTKNFLNRINQVEQKWQSEKVTGGTLFIGDSFFDEAQFFTNFYDLYKDQNAYCHGISSSRIEDWFVFSKRLVYPVNPSNIVLHLGTNDMFSGKENPNDMLVEMKQLFDEYFDRLPSVNIYWFAIEPRTYGINGGGFDSYSFETINLMNSLMEEYCSTDERLHYVDVLEHCYVSAGVTNANFFKDGVHPKLENYVYYCEVLKEAGLDLEISKPESNTTLLEFAVDSKVSASEAYIRKDDEILVKNFSISGKVIITNTGNNPHLEFAFDSSHYNDRFLIWDNKMDGVFQLGYAIDKTHSSNVNDVMINHNEEFTFEIIVTDKHAYLYINDNLELVFRNINVKQFTISSANTEAIFSDLQIITNKDLANWEEVLTRTEIAAQEKEVSTIKEVIVM